MKNHDFRPISRFISKMIQDRAAVSMECEFCEFFFIVMHGDMSSRWTIISPRLFYKLRPVAQLRLYQKAPQLRMKSPNLSWEGTRNWLKSYEYACVKSEPKCIISTQKLQKCFWSPRLHSHRGGDTLSPHPPPRRLRRLDSAPSVFTVQWLCYHL